MTSDSKNETEEVNNPKDPSASLALPTERNSVRHNLKKNGSSVCVMQWTGVIRDGTLMLERHLAIFVNCF
jgi:hypothetical protein